MAGKPAAFSASTRLLQNLVRQAREEEKIDIVRGKTLCVLGHPKLFEPIRNVLHRLPMSCYDNRQSLPILTNGL